MIIEYLAYHGSFTDIVVRPWPCIMPDAIKVIHSVNPYKASQTRACILDEDSLWGFRCGEWNY